MSVSLFPGQDLVFWNSGPLPAVSVIMLGFFIHRSLWFTMRFSKYTYTVRCLFSLRVRSTRYSRSSVRCWPSCFTLWIRSRAPTPVKYAKRISRKEERESKKVKNRWPCCFCVSPGNCRWFFIKERKMIAHSLCTSRSLQKRDIWKESVTGYCHLEERRNLHR